MYMIGRIRTALNRGETSRYSRITGWSIYPINYNDYLLYNVRVTKKQINHIVKIPNNKKLYLC